MWTIIYEWFWGWLHIQVSIGGGLILNSFYIKYLVGYKPDFVFGRHSSGLILTSLCLESKVGGAAGRYIHEQVNVASEV